MYTLSQQYIRVNKQKVIETLPKILKSKSLFFRCVMHDMLKHYSIVASESSHSIGIQNMHLKKVPE